MPTGTLSEFLAPMRRLRRSPRRWVWAHRNNRAEVSNGTKGLSPRRGTHWGLRLGRVTLSRGAILCDFDGCWSALVVSSPSERATPPVDDIMQHRAWVKGWTTDDHDRDFCSRDH